MKTVVDAIRELNAVLTQEQKDLLWLAIEESKEIGATSEQLAPIMSICIYGENTKPSKKIKADVRQLEEENELKRTTRI